MNMENRRFVRSARFAVALLALGATSACAHRPPAPSSGPEVWEVANASPCVANVAIVSRPTGQLFQRFGTVPAGTTQTYQTRVPSGFVLRANAVEADGITACRGIFDPGLVKVRKLPAVTG